VTFISVGSKNTDGINGFLDIINFLIGEASPPQVLTTSYGFNEPGIPLSIATCAFIPFQCCDPKC
jgi:tripeptidyl-peptidase I